MRIIGGLAAALIAVLITAAAAAAQIPTTTPTPGPGLTQPYATVITGCLAVVVALIAWTGVLLARRQTEQHFMKSHELELMKSLRDRYSVCAEQLAHDIRAVRQARMIAKSRCFRPRRCVGQT